VTDYGYLISAQDVKIVRVGRPGHSAGFRVTDNREKESD
jgi:hypothetical protein